MRVHGSLATVDINIDICAAGRIAPETVPVPGRFPPPGLGARTGAASVPPMGARPIPGGSS
ncbi:hypothetical protein FAIPA1_60064 [Frankia sp. AiPs1]